MNRWMILLAAGLIGCPAEEPAEDTGAPESDASVEDSEAPVGDTESEPGDSADTVDTSEASDTSEADTSEADTSEADTSEADTSEADSDSGAPADPLPDFTLLDNNPTSASFGADISPRGFEGTVTAWYFTRGTCGYCRSQYVKLQEMQVELAAAHPGLAIRLLSVNMVGSESGFDDLAAGGDLPVLQDTVAVNATDAWGAAWRDVFVLDAENRPVEVYNLTANDLHTAANYAHLRDRLVATASE